MPQMMLLSATDIIIVVVTILKQVCFLAFLIWGRFIWYNIHLRRIVPQFFNNFDGRKDKNCGTIYPFKKVEDHNHAEHPEEQPGSERQIEALSADV